MDDKDRLRFIHDLYEFNDEDSSPCSAYYFKNSDFVSLNLRQRQRKLLVNIHAFCIMDNHYHLLLSPAVENGVTKFMRKLNIGYAKSFNEKYDRRGALFEGRYKRILVKTDAHFIHLPYYIHFNPLDMEAPEWRERKLKNFGKAIEFLNNYRWSSHLDYLGKKNFPSVTQRGFLLKFFGGEKGYEKNIKEWLKDLSEARDLKEKKIFLE